MNNSYITKFGIGLLSAWCMVFAMSANAEIAIPSAPLGVTMSATPMTLLVASKDHKLFFEAYNDASDIDDDGILDTRFKPSITYYGLFDSNVCYTHSSNLFSPASAATNGKCSNQWSGNWLNYVTTSRIDALRKVLYGGYREVDSATETVLRRAYIPQDAHSWAKEYTSQAVDGYAISDYTPLSAPAADKRHFFGNLTSNENTDCETLDTCSDLMPLLSVVTNSTKRIWDWASKARPVLDDTHGGARKDYSIRVEVCTTTFHEGCKQYLNGNYKPTGLLHDYGEDETMLFGLLTGSYNKNMSGGVLRKVVSSFKDEVNLETGAFTSKNTIVQNLDNLRIRDFNNGRSDASYRKGSLRTRIMNEGEYIDWGNPIAEMMYEGLRYFAGKSAATSAYSTSDSYDSQVGLTVASWDNPYSNSSSAKSLWCSKPNMIVMSDINPSYDSDQIPGTAFGTFSGDVSGLNAQNLLSIVTENENINGNYFIGQSNLSNYDGAPTPKAVTSLGTVRGLAPEEPTKQGSYYSASVAYFGKTSDLNSVQGDQNIDSYYVALASPLPKIEIPINGKIISVVPFAKTIDGIEGNSGKNDTDRTKGEYQATNPIVDFYVEKIANTNKEDADSSTNGGRPYYKFRINYEADEQGNDFDMDVISEYLMQVDENNELEIKVKITKEETGSNQNVGYIISGTNRDGVYLVAQDKNESLAYFLNVPPGQDPGYCDIASPPTACNLLPYLGATSPNNESIQTFKLGSEQAATLLKDPLWYAAKWGGFIDKNDNDLPDLDYEWDADNDGVPDTYFLVQNPLKLEEALKRALDNIVDRTASASNVTSNSTSLNTDTLVFQSTFNSVSWSGDLLAYEIDSTTGVNDLPSWEASEKVPNARNIFITGTDDETTVFSWSELYKDDKTALINSDVLDYLRGSRSDEQQNGGTLRDRAYSNVLGDFVHSSPVYVRDTETVYLGGNDGMLHAFNALNGTELFAYIPSAVINRLEQITRINYNHQYFVDGEVVVSSQAQTNNSNYLIAALGHGGKGLFALDVTTPESFSTSDFKWSYFDTSDKDLGYMLGRPVIAKTGDNTWAVIAGNGYNSTNGEAVLYIFELESDFDLDNIVKIDTGVAGDNGLSNVATYDVDYDGIVDFVYAGDLKGNVWRFSLVNKKWELDLKGKPLFTAKDASKDQNPQPITAQITVVPNHDRRDVINYGKRFIFFGTGSYFRASDPSDTKIQTWYGLIDENAPIAGRNELVQRSIQNTGTFAGQSVRTFSQAVANDMKDKKGWYIDFNTEVGERVVTSSKYGDFFEPVLMVSSIIPIDDPCASGGRGYLNAISPFTGGRLKYGFFDINNNEDFEDEILDEALIGSFDPDVGAPGEAIIIGDLIVVSGSKGGTPRSIRFNRGNKQTTGRVSWREIITE